MMMWYVEQRGVAIDDGEKSFLLDYAVGSIESATALREFGPRGNTQLTRVDAGAEGVTLDDLAERYQAPDAIRLNVGDRLVGTLMSGQALLVSRRPDLEIIGACDEARAILESCGYSITEKDGIIKAGVTK